MPKGNPYTIKDIISKMPTGSNFTPLEAFEHFGKRRKMLFRCVCGVEKFIDINTVLSGRTKSCGCKKNETCGLATRFKNRYPVFVKVIYDKWKNMIDRCYNPRNISYKGYGGRGVRVCDEWRNSYESFLEWSLANGWKDGLQIDKDILGDGKLYSPSTCQYITPKENYDARKHILYVIYNGKKMRAVELMQQIGISKSTVYKRIARGLTLLESITTPVKIKQK